MKNAKLSKKEKKNLLRILIALVLFAAVFIADKIVYLGGVFESPAAWVFPFCLYLTVYLIIGYDVLWRAIRNIAHGQVLDENFLMCLATLGAFALAIYRDSTRRAPCCCSTRSANFFRNTPRANRASPSPRSWTSAPIMRT